jgi:hypothetical protein
MATVNQTQYIKDLIANNINVIRNGYPTAVRFAEIYGRPVMRTLPEGVWGNLSDHSRQVEAEAIEWAEAIQIPDDTAEASKLIDTLKRNDIVTLYLRGKADPVAYMTGLVGG